MYNKICIIPSPFNRTEIFECNDINGYFEYLKQNPAMCENVGAYKQDIKPLFDVDAYDEDIDIDAFIAKINSIYPCKPVYYALRNSRFDEDKNKYKYSYRFYVDKVKINILNQKKLYEIHNLFDDKRWDKSIYTKSRIMLLPHTCKKPIANSRSLKSVPELRIGTGDIFKCCASYIEEDFEDYNIIPELKVEEEVKEVPFIDDEVEEEEENIEEKKSRGYYDVITKHILRLSQQRAEEYSDWLEIIMCIVNIGDKYEWDLNLIVDLCNKFSQKSSAYNEKNNNKIIFGIMGGNGRNNKVGLKRILTRLKEDDPEYYKSNIVDSYKDVKKEFEKQYCVINNPPSYYRTPQLPRYILEDLCINDVEQQLKNGDLLLQTQNIPYMGAKKDSKGNIKYEKQAFIYEWLKDPNRLTYEGVVFKPSGLPEQCKKHYKNLFNGFKADKVDIVGYDDYANIQPILDHLKIVYCANNEDHYQYVLKWFAKIIQDPENRPQVSLVFYNKEHGTGRNTFTNFFANDILGCELSATARKIERVFGRFNSILAKCMFLVIEEAGGDLKTFMEDLKNMITEPDLTIEKKNIDAGKYKNFVNAIMLTNNEDILDIDDKDRRFCIFESSSEKKGDIEYFTKLYACINNKKNAGLFINYLRNEVDASWSPMQFQQNRPVTAVYRKQQAVNAKNYMKYISHITNDNEINIMNDHKYKWKKYKGRETIFIPYSILFGGYKRMCEFYKYTAYSYDKFFHNITCKGTGIYHMINKNTHEKGVRIYKDEVYIWFELFRNTEWDNIEEEPECDECEYSSDEEDEDN